MLSCTFNEVIYQWITTYLCRISAHTHTHTHTHVCVRVGSLELKWVQCKFLTLDVILALCIKFHVTSPCDLVPGVHGQTIVDISMMSPSSRVTLWVVHLSLRFHPIGQPNFPSQHATWLWPHHNYMVNILLLYVIEWMDECGRCQLMWGNTNCH